MPGCLDMQDENQAAQELEQLATCYQLPFEMHMGAPAAADATGPAVAEGWRLVPTRIIDGSEVLILAEMYDKVHFLLMEHKMKVSGAKHGVVGLAVSVERHRR